MIERVDLDLATEADLAAWYECRVAAALADLPGEPAPTRDQVTMSLVSGAGAERRVWVARDQTGRVVGDANLTMFGGSDNAHLGSVAVTVRPDARRAGIGRELTEYAIRVAHDNGRNTLWADTRDAPGPAGFAEAMGFTRNQTWTRRVLDTTANRERITRYATGAKARTDGFSLVHWVGRCPDELLDAYATACESFNDQPRGDLDVEPFRWTGERIRDLERARTVMRRRVRTMAVREDATGVIAGYTEAVPWPGSWRAEQAATAVLREFRGRGFGLWVKAAMIVWLWAECPEVTEYETGNADVNEHMIAVNERLGYRPVDTLVEWRRTVTA